MENKKMEKVDQLQREGEKSRFFNFKLSLYETVRKVASWHWQSFFLILVAAALLAVIVLQILPDGKAASLKTDLSQNLQSRP